MSLTPLQQAKPSAPPLKHSTKTKWRAGVLIGIHLIVAIRVAIYNKTGETISPVEPSEAMQTLEGGLVNAGFIFFILAILSTLIFGRFFCGWACHIVALQDLCGGILKKLHLSPKPFRSRLLVFVPIFAALYMFVWPQVERLLEKRPLPVFVQHLKTDDFWATFPNPAVAIFTFVVCGFLAVIFLGNKGFCTYACPYGAAFYAADRFAKGKIRVTDACNGCGHCTAVCTSNVRIHEEVRLHKMVVDPACMKCMDCVTVCPNKALYFGFGKASGKLRPTRQYDFTWPEEIGMAFAFLFALYAFRGLYEWFPFLLSLGWSAIFAYSSVMAWRLVSAKSVRMQRFQLKKSGGWTIAGYMTGLVMLALWGLTIHSSILQFNLHQAMGHLESAQEIYDGRRKGAEGEADRLVQLSYAEFEQVKAMALVPVGTWDARQGAIQVFLGDEEKAERHLKRALELNPELLSAIQPLFSLYERQARWPEAELMADAWLKRHPRRHEPIRAKGIALYNQQRLPEAREWLERADKIRPSDPAVLVPLAMADAAAGKLPEAEAMLLRAQSAAPENPRIGYNLALVQAEQGELRRGIETLTNLVKAHPDFLDAHNLRAQMAARANQLPIAFESADAMRQAGVMEPQIASLWAQLAVALGDPERALNRLSAELSDRYYAAALLARIGRTAEAESEMARIMRERNPAPARPF